MTKDLKRKSTPAPLKGAKSPKKPMTASEIAEQVLIDFRETFQDLARYDREEKSIDTIPY